MPTVLVIEDNHELQHYLSTVLRSGGHSVFSSATSQKAIEILKQQSFKCDLLLLDVHIGDGTAFDFLEQLKLENATFQPKICFVSSRRDIETVKRAVAMGASDYIVKPVLSGTLLTKVNHLTSANKVESVERYSSSSCNFNASTLEVGPVEPDLTVLRISETQMQIRSSSRFSTGSMVSLSIPELQKIIGNESEHIVVRVDKCDKVSWGKYEIESTFVGLGEERLSKLRALTIRGSAITGEQPAKRPA